MFVSDFLFSGVSSSDLTEVQLLISLGLEGTVLSGDFMDQFFIVTIRKICIRDM